MQRYVAALLMAVLVVGVAGAARAGDGDLLWSTEATGEAGTYRGSWTAAAGKGLVFFAGEDESDAGGAAFSVWAYRQRDGTLAWEDHYDREGSSTDQVQALALRGKRLVAVGSARTAAGGPAWTVRCYDARNGNLLWEDLVDTEGDLRDIARGVAIRGGTAYVVGQTETSTGGHAFTVRAMKLRDGSLLWEDRYDHEGSLSDVAGSVAVLGRRVVVTGTSWTTAGRGGAAIRAYDGRDGSLLWDDYRDVEGDGLDGYGGGVAVARGMAFAAGVSETTAGGGAMTVRAFKVKDGTLVWEDRYDREGAYHDSAKSLAVKGKLVVVGGRTQTNAGSAFSVRAYGAKDGAELWEHHRTRPADAIGFDSEAAETVLVGRGRAYAVGTTANATGGQGFTVVAFSARAGDVVWEDRVDVVQGDEWEEIPWISIRAGRRLFVSGERELASGDFVLPVLAYKAR